MQQTELERKVGFHAEKGRKQSVLNLFIWLLIFTN